VPLKQRSHNAPMPAHMCYEQKN